MAIVAAIFAVVLASIADLNSANEQALKVSQRVAKANELELKVIDLETGLRGLAITQERRFLEPRTQALKVIPGLERQLFGASDERSKALLQRIYATIGSFVNDYQARQLRAFQRGKIAGVAAIIKTGEGKRRVDAIRAMFARFSHEQQVRASEAKSAADAASSRAVLVSILGLVLTPLLIALVTARIARTVVRPVKDLSSAAERLRQDDLSARVAVRGAGSEIDTLGRAFNSMAASLQRNQVELEERNAELEAFSYSVSHDLRAPLRSIDGFSQALVDDFGDSIDEQGRDYLRRIRGAAARMAEQIDDLLRLARVARRDVRREPVDLTKLTREVFEELADADPQRHVEVRVEEGIRVEADRQLLKIVMENLVGNAWKFTEGRDPARIEVSSQADDGVRAYSVRDNGAGFDMAYADKLFGVFQRLHSFNEFEGTGVGLATVQRIVTKHEGRIWADAEVGSGATFHFTLEQRSKEARDGGSQPGGDPAGGGQPGRRGADDPSAEEEEHQQRDSGGP